MHKVLTQMQKPQREQVYRHSKTGNLYICEGVVTYRDASLSELNTFYDVFMHTEFPSTGIHVYIDATGVFFYPFANHGELVIYAGRTGCWARPLSMFQEHVAIFGKVQPRFALVK
jgi:hypothetical protein